MPRLPPALVPVAAAVAGAVVAAGAGLLLPPRHAVVVTVALATVPHDPFSDAPSAVLLGAASLVPVVTSTALVDRVLGRRASDVAVVAESVANEVLRITVTGPDREESETLATDLAGHVERVQQAELQRFRNEAARVRPSDPAGAALLDLQLGAARVHAPRVLGEPVHRDDTPSAGRHALAGGALGFAAAVLARWLRAARR